MRSFSGVHAYNPEHVIRSIVEEWMLDGLDVESRARDHYEPTITGKLTRDACPRCDGPLRRDAGDIPAGSRITPCRCVPICSRCGGDETNQAILGTGLSQFWRWPLRKGDITKRANRAQAMSTPVEGILSASSEGPMLITEDGATPVKMRPHSGGWAEFGPSDQ